MALTPPQAEQLALQRTVLHIEEALAHDLAAWRQRRSALTAELAEIECKIAQGEKELDQARGALLSGDVAQLQAAQDRLAPRPQLPPDMRPALAPLASGLIDVPLSEPHRFEPRPTSAS